MGGSVPFAGSPKGHCSRRKRGRGVEVPTVVERKDILLYLLNAKIAAYFVIVFVTLVFYLHITYLQ